MGNFATEQVASFSDFVAVIEAQRVAADRVLWYRGCGKGVHQLTPSLYRNRQNASIEDLIKLEKRLLETFRQRSQPFLPRPMEKSWELMFLMQHYGVPTRLLDWTESPFIALFFAVTSAPHELRPDGSLVFADDAAVWILDPQAWNKAAVALKDYDGDVLTTVDPNLNSNAYGPAPECRDMQDPPLAMYGVHNSSRIVAQRGVFVVFGKATEPMEQLHSDNRFPDACLVKLTFDRNVLPAMLTALCSHGIGDSAAFPDLDGLAREIRRQNGFEVY
ncbi:MAG: FRG domain-containing protein [Armatimonadia bacterium]